jgi:hypothetical protein
MDFVDTNTSISRFLPKVAPALAMTFFVAIAALVYQPGLNAGFQFDDFVNLNQIGATGPVDNWPTFWRFLTSGTADPTGRPLSLLTFLLDANDWPADPRPFLTTNLWIHLLNGALLWQLVRQLESGIVASKLQREAAALFTAAFWLLHPLFVSTTLYAVQREAMLPATFTLLGLLGYGWGRTRLAGPNPHRALCCLVFSILFGTIAATLSKANGILLPMLAGVLEATIWASGRVDPAIRRWFRLSRIVFLLLPSIAVVAYILTRVPALNVWYPDRGWSLAQRLLTEGRIIWDYIALLLIPSAHSSGLFNDAYEVSRSFSDPPQTTVAIVSLLAWVGSAVFLRKRFPRFSCASLFFLAGHLPALLFFWPAASALLAAPIRPKLRFALAVVLTMFLASTTFVRTTEWGDPWRRDSTGYIRSPDSIRARAIAAMRLTQAGDPRAAEAALGEALDHFPLETQLVFNKIDSACHWRSLGASDVVLVERTISGARSGHLLTHQWLTKAIATARHGSCRGLTLPIVTGWVDTFDVRLEADAALRTQNIAPLRARLALAKRDPGEAARHFDEALQISNSPDTAALAVAELAQEGHYSEAMSLLDIHQAREHPSTPYTTGMPWIHSRVLARQSYWHRELATLRVKLSIEQRRAASGRKAP